jgi:NgoFVII restriction endonuclease
MNDLAYYISLLKAFTSLTKLFSESGHLYLEYRAMENIFCNSFNAVNLAREDGAFDAKIGTRGYGLKTFGIKDKSLEKVAEFNKYSTLLRDIKSNEDLVCKLADLRNSRISTAINLHNLDSYIYHCIGRNEDRLIVFETEYPLICIENIRNINRKNTSLSFNDGRHEYNFNFSKSVLLKRFALQDSKIIQETNVSVLNDPYSAILQLSENFKFMKKNQFHEFVVLPLYSTAKSKKSNKIVSEKSGLNQWNSGGRSREYGEVYIPIPSDVHKIAPNFFPNRGSNFNLKTPDGKIINSKVCQDNSKALMTNPNTAISDWLLKQVFQLKEYELLTYDILLSKGYDAVRITKIDNLNFEITLAAIDEYEIFIEQLLK